MHISFLRPQLVYDRSRLSRACRIRLRTAHGRSLRGDCPLQLFAGQYVERRVLVGGSRERTVCAPHYGSRIPVEHLSGRLASTDDRHCPARSAGTQRLHRRASTAVASRNDRMLALGDADVIFRVDKEVVASCSAAKICLWANGSDHGLLLGSPTTMRARPRRFFGASLTTTTSTSKGICSYCRDRRARGMADFFLRSSPLRRALVACSAAGDSITTLRFDCRMMLRCILR